MEIGDKKCHLRWLKHHGAWSGIYGIGYLQVVRGIEHLTVQTRMVWWFMQKVCVAMDLKRGEIDFIWPEKTFCAILWQTLIYRNCAHPANAAPCIENREGQYCWPKCQSLPDFSIPVVAKKILLEAGLQMQDLLSLCWRNFHPTSKIHSFDTYKKHLNMIYRDSSFKPPKILVKNILGQVGAVFIAIQSQIKIHKNNSKIDP